SAGGCAATATVPPSQLSSAPGHLAAILSASSPEPDGKLGRMIQNPQLRIPGPTPIPARVQQAMDAPMINHRGPEFRALLPELEAAFAADIDCYTVHCGEAADPEDLDDLLSRKPDIATVFITHTETSTGVTNSLQSPAAVVKRHQRLLVVDGVISVASIALPV